MYTANGGQENHVRERLMWSGIEFVRQRELLRSRRLLLSYKISEYKDAILINVTFGCETVTLTSTVVRKYTQFNVRCLSTITGRAFAAERTKPTFDILVA